MNAKPVRLMWDGAKCHFGNGSHWPVERNSRNKNFITNHLSVATDSPTTYNPHQNYLLANGILCLESSRFMKCFQLPVTIKVLRKVHLFFPQMLKFLFSQIINE